MNFADSFTWGRPAAPGSVTVRGGKKPLIVWTGTGDLSDSFVGWERYRPMSDTPQASRLLTRVFTPQDAGALFGKLGPLSGSVQDGAVIPYATYSEPVSLWLDAAAAMRRAYAVHKYVHEADAAGLREIFKVGITQRVDGTDQTVTFAKVGKAGEARGVAVDDTRPVMVVDAGSDVFAQAHAVMLDEVNRGLKDHTRLTVTGRAGHLDVGFMPTDLLGAMWVQFVREILGNLYVEPCEGPGCQNWVVATPANKKRGKRYCSGACITAASRARNPKGGGS